MQIYHAISACCLLTLGCSTWQFSEKTTAPRLPQTQMSPRSVGIQIATVTLAMDEEAKFRKIIQHVDEQILPVEQRRHLANNGFVCGVVGTQLPETLHLLLMESANRREQPTAETFREMPDEQRFVQCRPNKRVMVEMWGIKKSVDARHHDGELIVPEQYESANGQFSIQCMRAGDDQATVELTPEFEHGQLKQKYVAEQGAFHIAAQRDRRVYEDLTMRMELHAGETLLVTCRPNSNRVGNDIFQNAERTNQKLLLVRLAQTRVDVSFQEGAD